MNDGKGHKIPYQVDENGYLTDRVAITVLEVPFLPETAPFSIAKFVKGLFGIGKAAKGGKSVFDIAKAGGRHSGFYKNYAGRSVDEINKAINTLQTGKRGINTHLDKIANPSKYVSNWNTLRTSHQQSLMSGWQKEISNANEQIQILKGILGK